MDIDWFQLKRLFSTTLAVSIDQTGIEELNGVAVSLLMIKVIRVDKLLEYMVMPAGSKNETKLTS